MQIEKDRNYIHQLEEKGEGRINWSVWDRVVEETRNELAQIATQKKTKQINHFTKKVYGYNSNGDLSKLWNSNVECATELNVSEAVAHNYSKKLAVVKETLLSRAELTKDVAFAHYRFAIEHGLVYGWNKKSGKPLYQYNEDGKLVAVWQMVKDWAYHNGYSSGTSYGCVFAKGDRIYKGRLTSFNLYDEETAKTIYKTARPIKNTKYLKDS